MAHTILGLLPLPLIYVALLATAIGTAFYSRLKHKVATEVFTSCYLAFLPLVSLLALARLFTIGDGPQSVGSALAAFTLIMVGVVLSTLIPAMVIYGLLSRMPPKQGSGENAV